MRTSIVFGILTLMSFSLFGSSSLQSLSFMIGCWENKKSGKVITESWSKESSNRLIGQGKTIKGTKVVFWEKLEILSLADRIVYIPSPMGRKSVSFLYKNQSDGLNNKALFINMSHDFPQQIIYALNLSAPNVLNVELRGIDKNRNSVLKKYGLVKSKCGE